MTAKEDLVESKIGNTQPTTTAPATDINDQQQQQQQQQQQSPPDYQTATRNENEIGEIEDEIITGDDEEPTFPNEDFLKLEEQINRIRWTIPVLSDGELIKCTRAAIRLAQKKLDIQNESCQRFIRDSLVSSFSKIFCDDAAQTWKLDIYLCIYKNTMLFIQLCVLKIEDDCFPLLDILSNVMNPHSRYNQANQGRSCSYRVKDSAEPFASVSEYRFAPRGWLVDFINKFGDLGGFDRILKRFTSTENKLNVPLIIALLKPWGLCHENLTDKTIKTYFGPIIETIIGFLDQLNENELKNETKNESKSDSLSAVMKWLRNLASRLPESDKAFRILDSIRLKLILRLLQTNSFSGKMNALNEVNKLLPSLTTSYHRSLLNRSDESEGLTSEKFVKWLQENDILDIVLRDCLHQPQYVEKLDKLLRFIIKEKALTQNDLAKIWNASCGKHEAIEKNVHELLAKLAWDFSPEQLEQLFECFRESWTKATKKQREKLLELIRRLAEDDKEGLMANKVLELLWNLSHDEHLPIDIIDQASTAHLKILDASYLFDKEKVKITWIDRIIEEIKKDQNVIISLKQIREISLQFMEELHTNNMTRMYGPLSRLRLIDSLERKHQLSEIITENLCTYMADAKQFCDKTNVSADEYFPDGRFNHHQQVHERLNFLKFILKEGRSYLPTDLMKKIWTSLVEKAVYPVDRERCFRWFAEIIDEVGFESRTGKDFFQNHLMKLEPQLLTDFGMICFDRFFKTVNTQSNKFHQRRRTIRLINDDEIIGIDYLWKLILKGSNEVAERGIQLIKEVYTNMSSQLTPDIDQIHKRFIDECFQRIKNVYTTMKPNTNEESQLMLIRILTVLREYLYDCDSSYKKERSILPMSRAFRGRPVLLIFRINTGQSRQTEEFEHQCHANETWGQIRRFIYNRCKSHYGIMELIRKNELIHSADDNKTLSETDGCDRIQITVRWVQHSNQISSSGDSSSSESEMNNNIVSCNNRIMDSVNVNAENALPSVIFSHTHEYYQFLIEISDLACKENNIQLRDITRQILDLLPLDNHVKSTFITCFQHQKSNHNNEENVNNLKNFYFQVSPTQMLYNLKTTFIKLSPAFPSGDAEVTNLHILFLNAEGLVCLLNILTDKKYTDQCDLSTRKSIYLTTLYILKRFLSILGFYQLLQNTTTINTDALNQILPITPMTVIFREPHPPVQLEKHIAQLLVQYKNEYPIPKKSFLEYEHIIGLIRLIWCLASTNRQILFENDFNIIHSTFRQENFNTNEYYFDTDESELVCRECLELFCISTALVPSSVESLFKESFFSLFFIDMILYCRYGNIRQTSIEQILTLTTRCSQGQCENLLKYFINEQFQMLNKHSNDLKIYSFNSSEFFLLLCRLLSFSCKNQISLSNIDQQLHDEIDWLTHIVLPVDEYLLYGHLSLAKELLQFQTSEQKHFYGIGQSLIQLLIEQFLFPASKLLYEFHLNKQRSTSKQGNEYENNELKEPPVAICQSSPTISAAFDLLVTLGTNSIENLQLIDKYMTDFFFFASDSKLVDWDFSLPIGSRPDRSFVGLKNAGATCYMNSVLQQLFMIRSLRSAILSVKIPSEFGEDEFDEDDMRREVETSTKGNQTTSSPPKDVATERKEYHIQIFRQIQRMFGHLLESKLQFYVPRGFWKTFKFAGEPINLREQQDAVEFLNNVVDSLDEALKAFSLPQTCSKVLGGKFADQKICKDCPHRYSREEDFTSIIVDIRHSQTLKESLEQYVIGELLDGPNAYFCEKCNKKVDTIKRTCFKKLPSVLVIQLKRFDYDWERETPIKFNDYFEFPRELDMEPYTVQGLAKAEGTSVIEENTSDEQTTNNSTQYKLVGIIVHLGQANGGHYYSFIQYKDQSDNSNSSHWYKFDDTDVSECKMDDDEELRSQCFGGDHPSSSFDQPPMKRQRRWWNAYILFYEKISDQKNPVDNLSQEINNLQLFDQNQRMPLLVQRSVRKQNIKFLHDQILFSVDFFTFIKRLVQNNVSVISNLLQHSNNEKSSNTNTIEQLALICVQIATKFLFSVGWHTKKTLRGAANDWSELISNCIRNSRQARKYLAEILFKHPNRFQEYLVDCTTADIRSAFSRIILVLGTCSRQDNPESDEPSDEKSVEDTILKYLLRIINKDVPDNSKSLAQYFQFFMNFYNQGKYEYEKLLHFNAPSIFTKLAMDDTITSPISRYGEPSRLFIALSALIRCFDVSEMCRPNDADAPLMPNPYATIESNPICPIPEDMINVIYKHDGFLKKIVEDASLSSDSQRLLRFIIWENPDVSSLMLNEIFILLSKFYPSDFRIHLDILLLGLTIEDSWQEARLLYALKGIPIINSSTSDDENSPTSMNNMPPYYLNRDSLFDIYMKARSSNQKRAYQFIKILVQLFNECSKARHFLQTDQDIKQHLIDAAQWLHEQLERQNNIPSTYTVYPSQGQSTSNDISHVYRLERTQSARSVLEKAIRLCSNKDDDDDEEDYSNSDDNEDESVDHELLRNPSGHHHSRH